MHLQFTIADGKRPPRSPGITLKVDGKAVGKPTLFGLDEDEEIPAGLARRVYGEVELPGLGDFVTADWGGMIENSKAYVEAREHIVAVVKSSLRKSHACEMNQQRARLRKRLDRLLARMPEHRRRYAEEALQRILKRFYGETDDRIATIADVALDAMEHDAYWMVFEEIGRTSRGAVAVFAQSLEDFGLMELSTVAEQAMRRLAFMDYFDQLARDPRTLEKDVHKAFETNLWMLGRRYSAMASNKTLGRIVADHCAKAYSGSRAAERPDLLLSQDAKEAFLLIEFKRPAHLISRRDIAQAETYRDELAASLPSTSEMDIIMLGGGREATIDGRNMAAKITINSYSGLISAARNEMQWLVSSLGTERGR